MGKNGGMFLFFSLSIPDKFSLSLFFSFASLYWSSNFTPNRLFFSLSHSLAKLLSFSTVAVERAGKVELSHARHTYSIDLGYIDRNKNSLCQRVETKNPSLIQPPSQTKGY